MMASEDEAQSTPDDGSDGDAVARGAPCQAGERDIDDGEEPGRRSGRMGEDGAALAAAAAETPAAERATRLTLCVEAPCTAGQRAGAPLPMGQGGGAVGSPEMDSCCVMAAASSAGSAVCTGVLQQQGTMRAVWAPANGLAAQHIQHSVQLVQQLQQLAEMVQTQMTHMEVLVEEVMAIRKADKARDDELRQLRDTVAAQQRQVGSGARAGAGTRLRQHDPASMPGPLKGLSAERLRARMWCSKCRRTR
jgi:hypothetical protein